MNLTVSITNSNIEDLSEIFILYSLATEFQKIKFPGNCWPRFEEKLITNEINENRQFKLIIENRIACIWAITFNDIDIWEDKENNCSLYIHRIATNPEFRGNNFIENIVDWAKKFALDKNISFIRLDTCGKNDRLIKHYKSCGFNFLGVKKLKNTLKLPPHYHNADVCFFEISLK